MRTFDSGATRDTSDGKLDFHEYLSPAVLRRYSQYMLTKQVQPDGEKRPGNNWKKGLPTDVYMASLTRHFMDVWLFHEGRYVPDSVEEEGMTLEIALCALLFNVMGYLDNLLIAKEQRLGPMGQEFVAKGYEGVGVSTPVEFAMGGVVRGELGDDRAGVAMPGAHQTAAAKKAEAAAEEGLCQAARRAEEKLRRDWSVANPSLCPGCGRYGPGGPCPTCYPGYTTTPRTEPNA